MNRLLQKHLPVMLSGSVKATPQSEETASYYPKREAKDGIITWEHSSLEIYNLVRAVTRPFPGAFSFLGEKKVVIWSAIPFDSKIRYPRGSPGEIVEVFENGQFVVKTGDTSMLVLKYEADSQQDIRVGGQFHSSNIEPKKYKQLPIPAKEYFTDSTVLAPVGVEKQS
jgi:methionyl-tRNA formyltransferase